MICMNCHHATWDCEEYYFSGQGTQRRYFITGCRLGLDDPEDDECESYCEEMGCDTDAN